MQTISATAAIPAEVHEINAIRETARRDPEATMADCEAQFPGYVAEQLRENESFIALLVRNHYYQTARTHGREDVMHEATVGAARGIAGWKLNPTPESDKPRLRGYIRNAIRFHMKEQFAGKSGPITHAFCRKIDPANPKPLGERMIRLAVSSINATPTELTGRYSDGGIQLADRSESETAIRERLEETAERIAGIHETAAMLDFTGITTWICDCIAAGRSHRNIGAALGISKTRVSQVVDELRKWMVGESNNRNAIRWSQRTIDTFTAMQTAAA